MKRNAATHLYRHLPYMEIINAEQDIGVVIDDKLLFSQHMAEKVNKGKSVLGAIERSSEFMDTYTLKKLYTTLVRPHIEYAHAVWNPCTKKNIPVFTSDNVQLLTRYKDGTGSITFTIRERLRKSYIFCTTK